MQEGSTNFKKISRIFKNAQEESIKVKESQVRFIRIKKVQEDLEILRKTRMTKQDGDIKRQTMNEILAPKIGKEKSCSIEGWKCRSCKVMMGHKRVF